MDRYKNFIEFFNVIVIIFVFLAPGIIAMIYLGKISLGWSLSLIPGILIALILSNRKHWPRLTAFDTRYTREGYIQGASDYSRAYVTKAFDVNITTERQDKRDLIIIAIVFIGAIVWWYLKIN